MYLHSKKYDWSCAPTIIVPTMIIVVVVVREWLFQQAQATIAPTTIILANTLKPSLKHSPSVNEL